MDFSKFKNKLLIILCLIVLILPFYLITFSYGAEFDDYTSVSYIDTIPSLASNVSNTKFYTFGSFNGYVYDISNTDYLIINSSESYDIDFAFSIDYPAIGVSYYEPYKVLPSTTYYIDLTDKNYNYFVVSTNKANDVFSVKTKNNGMIESVDGLVNNVGINSLWNIFDISVNYIVVVVLFAFGVYIIFRIIRKISKGKEGL